MADDSHRHLAISCGVTGAESSEEPTVTGGPTRSQVRPLLPAPAEAPSLSGVFLERIRLTQRAAVSSSSFLFLFSLWGAGGDTLFGEGQGQAPPPLALLQI